MTETTEKIGERVKQQKLISLTPRKALNKAFLKVKPTRNEIESFKTNLITLLDRTNGTESEEFHKNLVSDFLKDTYYKKQHFINTKGKNDLVIHNGHNANSTVGVIIEAKKPNNKDKMITTQNLNKDAFHKLVLYYLRERVTHKNLKVKHLIATNINEWFIFDEYLFERLFAQNKSFVREFEDFEASKKKTEVFYKDIAEPFINTITDEIEFTYFNIQDYQKPLRNNDKEDDNLLITLFKIFSPEHLLKLPFANDSNSLDKGFYSELLHIIGLTETKEGNKKLIERNKVDERNTGTILESVIVQLDSLDKLSEIQNINQFGNTIDEQLFNIAIELTITWINRILFLKLLEAQLLTYHKGNKSYLFFNLDKIKNYDDLNSLFFQVLAKKYEERNPDVKKIFEKIPYLNSSLFELTELENKTLVISNLQYNKTIPIFAQTVIKDRQGKKRAGNLNTLEYLFEFLNAYDFGAEGNEEIQEENKTLINASVLGLIFEKINGYKDGSFFTPGFITMYMCRETIRKAIIQKFDYDFPDYKINKIENIYELIPQKISRQKANEIINSIKICDPAVGSGHFLVSALNELIAIKNDLKILEDKEGRSLHRHEIEIINDELTVIDEEGKLFKYNPNNKESQRIQESLFHEKQTIIENCLFGVDINPNSVKICQLRLWIELLKNAYYKEVPQPPKGGVSELETLPNIDINIKQGNSLISRFDLKSDLYVAGHKDITKNLLIATMQYKNEINKETKRELKKQIKTYKQILENAFLEKNLDYVELRELENKHINLLTEKQKIKIKELKNKLENDTLKPFEWRYEFPEVLDERGNFIGFDVVIGNPPYIKEYEGKEIFDGLRTNEVYQGKMDIWYMFGSDGIKLLKENGYLNFIAQNNWITNAGAGKFRNFILKNAKILELTDFGSFMVFDSASIQTMTMFLKKEKVNEYSFKIRRILSDKPNLEDALDLINGFDNDSNELIQPKIKVNDFIDKNLTFNLLNYDLILNKMIEKSNFKLDEKEVANGIHPHHDFVNKNFQYVLGDNFKVGDGIFGLSESEKNNLNLTKKELKLIKPYFNSKQFFRYYAIPKNEYWIIYTSSKFKNPSEIIPYPNIKKHLDQFQSVITSDNKPYGLHRTRVEDFFIGEKIIVQRKCPNKPVFTYTDFDSYVSATFYVIKTSRLNQKYLTGLLNSRLIEFWLKHKGKMQGNNYQIDKAPLLELPLIKSNIKNQEKIEDLVEKITKFKKQDSQADTTKLENEIDLLVYKLYGLKYEEVKIIDPEIEEIINERKYELYGLIEEEIKIVEESIK